MTPFEQSQSAFVAALRDPAHPLPASIARRYAETPSRRFNVYRNNVYAGLIGVLEARYPAVQRLLGDEFFKAMARIFIDRHPPRSPVLIEYGSELPEFLRTFEPATDEPYLPDVAHLEWRMHRARHAADSASPEASHLVHLDEPSAACLMVRLAPAVSLVTSEYPIFSLWRANASADLSNRQQMFSGAEFVLVTRPDLVAEAVRIPKASAVFIAALMEHKPLGAAIAAALAANPNLPLQRTIALLIAQKAISSITQKVPAPEETLP